MSCTPDERMTVAAARRLRNGDVCFVGIGLPSAAANLARLTHAPDLVLIYESGTIGTRPEVLPLSIGDGELAQTADCVVPLPEIFTHYLQAGRIDVGFLGAAQIDRHGNLNPTVIGPYNHPKMRLPGAGGAPEIARHAREILIVMKLGLRTFVDRLDFVSSPGAGRGQAPKAVITDLGILSPDADGELVLTALYAGVRAEEVLAVTGWPLRVAPVLETEPDPTPGELEVLRALHARTRAAHARPPVLPF